MSISPLAMESNTRLTVAVSHLMEVIKDKG